MSCSMKTLKVSAMFTSHQILILALNHQIFALVYFNKISWTEVEGLIHQNVHMSTKELMIHSKHMLKTASVDTAVIDCLIKKKVGYGIRVLNRLTWFMVFMTTKIPIAFEDGSIQIVKKLNSKPVSILSCRLPVSFSFTEWLRVVFVT